MPAEWRARLGARLALALSLGVAGASPLAQAAPPAERLQQCAACHGSEGRTRLPEIPSLAGQPRLFLENQMVLIREGLRVVPAMKGLLDGVSDPEIIEMARYFSAQAPAEAAAGPSAPAYARGRGLASRLHCGSCHLPDYAGQQQVPRLAGQPEPFLRNAMKQLRDHPGPGRDSMMAAVLYGLKDEDLSDLAHYLAHFRP